MRFKIGRATPRLPKQLSLGRLLLHRSPFVSLLSVAFSLLLRLQQYMVPISGIRSSSSLQYSRKAARQVREPARSSQGLGFLPVKWRSALCSIVYQEVWIWQHCVQTISTSVVEALYSPSLPLRPVLGIMSRKVALTG